MTLHDDYEPTREDVLIGRVVDHEATPTDWAQLDELASEDPGLWSRLGRAQRAHAGLRIAVEDAITEAELIDIPSGHLHTGGRVPRWKRVVSGAGWAIAATLALLLLNPLVTMNTPSNSAGILTAGMPRLLSQASAEEAFTQYVASGLADGRVVSEMPALVLEQNLLPDGQGTEVFVVRRVVERLNLPSVTNFAQFPDEHGTLRLTPTEPRPPSQPSETTESPSQYIY